MVYTSKQAKWWETLEELKEARRAASGEKEPCKCSYVERREGIAQLQNGDEVKRQKNYTAALRFQAFK